MSSIIVAGDVSGSVTLQAPSAAGTTTLTLPSTSGTEVTTNGGYVPTSQLASGTANSTTYLRGDQTWATISSGGMTLLGTITITGGNSVSLGSLSLTSYKALFISATTLQCSTNANVPAFISNNNVQTGVGGVLLASSGTGYSGTFWLDLTNSAIGGGMYRDIISATDVAVQVGGKTNITTASTTIYFRLSGSNTFDGGGSIKIYGVA